MAGKYVTGTEAVLRALHKMRTGDAVNISVGLQKCAQIILRKALYYVPRDTEALARSGNEDVTGSGFGTRAVVTFGGDINADYAWIVHEDMEARHAPPTSAKYLTRAVNETRGTCTALMRRQFLARTAGVPAGRK